MALQGDRIDNRYVVRDLLGRGSSGVVYRVFDADVGDEVALKLYHPHFARLPRARERFLNELRIARRASHPGIVRLFDVSATENGDWYLTMELVTGGNLRDWVFGPQAHSCEQIFLVLDQVFEAVAHLHATGIAHLDLKPENVLITATGSAKLSDFSIARELAPAESACELAETIGSPFYMSPEQCRSETPDFRSDVYSLGLLSYTCVCGAVPFDAAHFLELVEMHLHTPIPPLRPTVDLPAWFQAFVARAAQKNPDDRFPSAALMLEDFRKRANVRTKSIGASDADSAGKQDRSTPDSPERRRKSARRNRAVRRLQRGSVAMGLVLFNILLSIRLFPAATEMFGAALLFAADRCVELPVPSVSCDVPFNAVKRIAGLPPGRDYLRQLEIQEFKKYFDALRAEHYLIALALARCGVRDTGADSETLLSRAVQFSWDRAALFLLRAGADPTRLDRRGRDTLNQLITAGWSKKQIQRVLPELLSQGVNVDLADGSGLTPLHQAVRLGNSDIIKLLIEHGADLNARDAAMATPLLYAVGAGSPTAERLTTLLLSQPGIDARIVNQDGVSPLVFAIQLRNVAILHRFASAHACGVDVGLERPIKDGITPLGYAVTLRDGDSSQLLMRMGASLDVRDASGTSVRELLQAAGLATLAETPFVPYPCSSVEAE